MEEEKVTVDKVRAIQVGRSQTFYVGAGEGARVRVIRSMCANMVGAEGIKGGFRLRVNADIKRGFVTITKYAV